MARSPSYARQIMAAAGTDRAIDLLGQLKNLVHNLNRSDITSVQTLLTKLLGNQNAALMCV